MNKINSSFTDYYDETFKNRNENIVYDRNSKFHSINERLKFLSDKGIGVLKLTPICNSVCYQVMVIMDGREQRVKKVMTNYSARSQYLNGLCFESGTEIDHVLRFVQVGKKRYLVKLNVTDESGNLEPVELTVMQDGYADWMESPIFTIDYIISSDNKYYAIDISECPRLGDFKFDKVLSSEEVSNEIENFFKRRK